MSPERAREVLSKQTAFGTFPELTDDERAEVGAVWKRMPGYTCFYDALVRIARAEVQELSRNGSPT